VAQPSTIAETPLEAGVDGGLALEPWPPPTSRRITARSLVSGVALNYLGVAIVSGIGFFLTPYMIRTLGATSYGVMALSISMLGYASLLDFGIGLSVMKLIADRVNDRDRTETRKIVSTVLVFYSVVGLVVFGAALALFGPISGSFHVPPAQADDFRTCYILAAATIGFTFPQSVFTAVITGHSDFGLQNRFVIGAMLASACGTVWLLQAGKGIVSVSFFALETAIVMFAVKVIVVGRRYGIGFSRRYVDHRILPKVLAFASWVFVINVASKVIFDTDVIVVGALLGPAAVAVYQVALSPNVVLRKFGEQFNVVALTGASTLQAEGQQAAVRRLFLESTRMTAVIMLPFAIVFGAWGNDFVRLWVGDGFHGADFALLYLTLAMIAIAIQGTASQIIMAYSRHKVMAIATACEASANLALSIVLGHRYGVAGVALGTLLPTLVTAFAVSLPYAARLTGCSPWDVALRIVPPVIGAAALVAAFRLQAAGGHTFGSMITFAVTAAGVFLVFVGLNVGLFARERGTYVAMARRRIRSDAA
jgi:O-antigen/teichoic acid export membrane protein